MVGVKSRSTMYRHLKTKNISISKDDNGQPRIELSELIRVYGDKVKMPEEGAKNLIKAPSTKMIQDKTGEQSRIELEVLRERVMHLQAAKDTSEAERRKERELLTDQIDHLRKALEEEQGQIKRLIPLITDQSGSQKQKEEEREGRFKEMERIIHDLKESNERFTAMEAERRKRIEEKRKAAQEAQAVNNKKSFWPKFFG